MYRLLYTKLNLLYEKKKDFTEAMEVAEELVNYHRNDKELEYAVGSFVNCKVKIKAAKKVLNCQSITAKKFEIRAYRQFQETLEDRIKVAEDILEHSDKVQDKLLAHLEMIWVKLAKKEDFSKCIKQCEKLTKSNENHPLSTCLVHFWLAISIWSKAKHELQVEVKQNESEMKAKINQDDLEIGDLTSVYSKILNLDLHQSILNNLKKCKDMLKKVDATKIDPMFNETDIASIQKIVNNMLEMSGHQESKSSKDLLSIAWQLLEKGEFQQVEKLTFDINKKNTVEDRLVLAESHLIKGYLQWMTGKNPVMNARSACYSTAFIIQHFNNASWQSLDVLELMFQGFKILCKSRKLYLQCLSSIGLGKEMRMLAKMGIEAGVEIALLPQLCQHLLNSVEVDLLCDDGKQAQHKLRDACHCFLDHKMIQISRN